MDEIDFISLDTVLLSGVYHKDDTINTSHYVEIAWNNFLEHHGIVYHYHQLDFCAVCPEKGTTNAFDSTLRSLLTIHPRQYR